MSDNFELDDNYGINENYSDPQVFIIGQEKAIPEITGQLLIAGENNAQSINFEMDRYYDGIDISDKQINILYSAPQGYADICHPINVKKGEDKIRFTWVVPAHAVMGAGELIFSVEFVGDDYVLKTLSCILEIEDGMLGHELVSPPEDKEWYLEMQNMWDRLKATAESEEERENAENLRKEAENKRVIESEAALKKATEAVSKSQQVIADCEKAAEEAKNFELKIDDIREDLGNFKINNVAGKSVLLEQSISKKYVYFNTQYKLLGFGNNEYNTCKIYKIEKNKKYYLIAYGKNNEGYPLAVFADNLIEEGTTAYTDYILGEENSFSMNNLSFRAKTDGYMYVNAINASCGLFENLAISESEENSYKMQNAKKYKLSTYGEFQKLDIDVKEGVLFDVLSKSEKAYDGCRYTILENDNTLDTIKVTGYSFSENTSYPLICFFDEYMNVIEMYGAPSTLYTNEIFEIPYRTKYIVINARNNISLEKFIPRNGLFEKINRLSDELLKPVSFSKIKGLKYLEQKYEVKNIIISDYEVLSKIIYNGNGNKITSDLFNTVLIPIDLELDSIKILYAIGVYGGAFLDSQKNWISSFSTNKTGVIYNVPINTEFIAYTCHKDHGSFELGINFNLYASEQLKSQASSSFKNPWEGKKVVLLGTSVGFGSNATKSYMQEASNYLGFTLVNTSVPGLAIHTNTDGTKLIYGSTCLSIAEYKEQGMNIPDAPKDYVPGGSYNDYYRTWEHIFTEENADADLWLYAVAPNNGNFKLDDWNAFNKSSWKYNDGSSFDSHRTTFIGALLYLMDKMYTLNPNARMAFVLDSAFAYGDSEGKGNLETVSKQWGIPLVDLWGKINRSPKSLEVIKSKNGTDNHPSTFGHEKMGMMMAGELLRIG